MFSGGWNGGEWGAAMGREKAGGPASEVTVETASES